jgi:short-subunit dehydrogenase
MENLYGKVAAVTGAASGIGRSLAVNLAAEGCELALADINSEGLAETAGMFQGKGIKVTTHVVDMAGREQVYDFAEDVFKQHGKINIIINNAGVTVGGTLEDVSYENFEWLFGINFWGVVYGTKAFLPYLMQCSEGHIVNISSIFGLMPFPFQGTYCASKFAVRGFTETLIQELRSSHIGVTSVHPGGVKTNVANDARMEKLYGRTRDEVVKNSNRAFVTSPDRAAKKIVRAVKKGKKRLLIGPDAYIVDILVKICPLQLMKATAAFFDFYIPRDEG